MTITTESIIDRVLAGEIDAYGEIVRHYQHEIWRLVALALRDTATTEDLVQQVFVDAYFHLEQYEPGRDFGAWQRTVARNLVRKELRRGTRESRKFRAYHQHLLERLENDPENDEHHAELREALAAAPERTWFAAEMRVGAYMAFALNALRTAQPGVAMMFPDASELGRKESDPPLVLWAASQDGEIVTYMKMPTTSVANLVRYFEKIAAAFGGAGVPPPPKKGEKDLDIW